MFCALLSPMLTAVALLAEGVDRNVEATGYGTGEGVALLAEGVDRNSGTNSRSPTPPSRPPRGGRG